MQVRAYTVVTEACSSIKRCLPEVKARYKASVKHSANDISSTFTVSTCQVSGFTRSVTRMYLLC